MSRTPAESAFLRKGKLAAAAAFAGESAWYLPTSCARSSTAPPLEQQNLHPLDNRQSRVSLAGTSHTQLQSVRPAPASTSSDHIGAGCSLHCGVQAFVSHTSNWPSRRGTEKRRRRHGRREQMHQRCPVTPGCTTRGPGFFKAKEKLEIQT